MLFALIGAPASAQTTERVRVELQGVSGKLEQRVRSVLSMLGAAEGGRLEESEIRRLHAVAPREIKRALEASGYYRSTVRADLVATPDGRLARYRIEIGPPIIVDTLSVRVTGPGARDTAFVRRARQFPLRVGQVLDHLVYEQGKQALAVYAAENGYLDANFETHVIEVSLERNRAKVDLALASGPRFVYGEVSFKPHVLDYSLLMSYVPFQRGDPVRSSDLLELQTKLSEVPYFARVEVQPRRDLAVGNELPIEVTLITRKATRFSSGVGIGTDTGPYVRAGAEFRRINRRGHRAEVSGKLATSEKSVELQYTLPRVAGRDQLLSFRGGYADLETQVSHSRTAQLGAALLRRHGAWNEVISLTFKREQFDVGADAGVTRFLIPDVSWSTTRRNDPIDPRRGHHVQLSARAAHRDVLSDVTFGQLEAEAKYLQGFRSPRHRVLARVHGGQTWTDAFADMPATMRFFAGGVQSVRGYDYESLGPTGADGRVVGGEQEVDGSLEYEFRVLDTWGLAAFFDAGDAFHPGHFELKSGAGFGLRWLSPVGLVRFDAALPGLDRNERVKFHFSIGPSL